MIKIVNEDLIYHIKEYEVILLASNIKNTRGNGFHKKVCINFPYVFDTDKDTPYNDPRKLGKIVQTEEKEDLPIFVHCYMTKGRHRPDVRPDTVEYDSLRECLKKVKEKYGDKKIASTIIGNSPFEGGGDKERIINIFNEELGDSDVTLFDFIQEDCEAENAREWHEIIDMIGKIPVEEYYDRKKRFLWKETFGIYTDMPDLSEREIKKIIKEYKNK